MSSPKWEYKVDVLNGIDAYSNYRTTELMNVRGADGWEIIHVSEFKDAYFPSSTIHFYCKRQVEDVALTSTH